MSLGLICTAFHGGVHQRNVSNRWYRDIYVMFLEFFCNLLTSTKTVATAQNLYKLVL